MTNLQHRVVIRAVQGNRASQAKELKFKPRQSKSRFYTQVCVLKLCTLSFIISWQLSDLRGIW